uniref:LD24950p n=1 Tax=Drosophila melanogaster TaxID=7227 RepID=Q8MSB8_DROME|nr:LD24950p [Drosophila melanogaster]
MCHQHIGTECGLLARRTAAGRDHQWKTESSPALSFTAGERPPALRPPTGPGVQCPALLQRQQLHSGHRQDWRLLSVRLR